MQIEQQKIDDADVVLFKEAPRRDKRESEGQGSLVSDPEHESDQPELRTVDRSLHPPRKPHLQRVGRDLATGCGPLPSETLAGQTLGEYVPVVGEQLRSGRHSDVPIILPREDLLTLAGQVTIALQSALFP